MHINMHELQKEADIMVVKFTSISNGKDAETWDSSLSMRGKAGTITCVLVTVP